MSLNSKMINRLDEYIQDNAALNICIITHCYPPDFGAAPHQYAHMAENLKRKGHKVTVLTSHPYYPSGKLALKDFFSLKKNEKINGVDVIRHWLIPSQKNSLFLRFVSMLTMLMSMLTSLPLLKKKKIDLVIVQTPPISLPILGVLLKKTQKVKLILNVSDLWPQAMVDLKSIHKDSFSYKLLHGLEKKFYKAADYILTQSLESQDYIQKMGFKRPFLYRIGANIKHFSPKKEIQFNQDESLSIVYTGVLGVAHGILDLIKTIPFDKLNVDFHIYGDGIEANQISKYLKQEKLKNVFLHAKVSYKEIPAIVKKYNVALISQKNYVKGTLPAKMYESMSLGMPILFHGEGEGYKIINQHQCGFTSLPSTPEQLIKNIEKLKGLNTKQYNLLSKNARNACLEFYDRDKQFNDFYYDIIIKDFVKVKV